MPEIRLLETPVDDTVLLGWTAYNQMFMVVLLYLLPAFITLQTLRLAVEFLVHLFSTRGAIRAALLAPAGKKHV